MVSHRPVRFHTSDQVVRKIICFDRHLVGHTLRGIAIRLSGIIGFLLDSEILVFALFCFVRFILFIVFLYHYSLIVGLCLEREMGGGKGSFGDGEDR